MITEKQRDVLAYIQDYTATHAGVSPSYREIATACGLGSKSHVNRVVRELEGQGRLVRLKYRARAIQVVGPAAAKPKPKPRVVYSVANAEFWKWNDAGKCLDRWFAKK